MAERKVEQRLRRFLMATVAAIFIGSVFELILLEHYEKSLQLIPFIVSGIGLIAVGGAWFRPNSTTLQALRWVMMGVAITSLAGVYLHFSGNLAFTREINPSYTLAESIWPAMKGSYPLLAPGILFLAGALGIAATWRHPVLEE